MYSWYVLCRHIEFVQAPVFESTAGMETEPKVGSDATGAPVLACIASVDTGALS